ncbi:hypothetical protein CC80DRAFT_591837 [Byssothecium circinans]|uniref:DUF6535 domain-containing protein n=1 Tax=Byssothecium circinans TaxID=147558 RepID=A0A6A5U295_9PLEO|nr:hypothetical protein CC80DRAFT_591837 [Byssothecium circinans]
MAMPPNPPRMADTVPDELEKRTSPLLLRILIGCLTAPYRRTFKLYTWHPLRKIRYAGSDRRALIALVRDFEADKYAELQSVQVAASFCGGATLGTISWTRDPNANTLWVAEALWLCSLVCSIWAVIMSIQTKSILDDLPDKDELNEELLESEVKRMVRTVSRCKRRPGISHWAMVFIWQFPSMTMSYAWTTFIAGLTVYICNPFIRHEPWGNKHLIAIVYFIVGSIGLVTYILSSVFVYVGEKDFELSVARTRANSTQAEDARPKTRRQPCSSNGETADDLVQLVRARSLPSGPRREANRSRRWKRQLLI